jgi:hypothetical protein
MDKNEIKARKRAEDKMIKVIKKGEIKVDEM